MSLSPRRRNLVLIAALVMTQALVVSAGRNGLTQKQHEPLASISLEDCPLPDAIATLAGAADAKIVFPGPPRLPNERVSLHLKDATLADALEALGLDWEMRGDVFIVKGLKGATVATSPVWAPIPATLKLPEGWLVWSGSLPLTIAEGRFVPTAMEVSEDDSRLSGTLTDLVADLKQAGLTISLDPGVAVATREASIDIARPPAGATVEQALFRGIVSAGANGAEAIVIQRQDEADAPVPTLRIVSRQQVAGDGGYAIGGPLGLPLVLFDEGGRRLVHYPRGSGLIELSDGTRLPVELSSDTVSIQTKSAPLHDLVKMLSQVTGIAMTLADDVDSRAAVTLSLQGMPVSSTLAALLSQADLHIEIERDDAGEFKGFLIRPKATPDPPRTCPHDGTPLRSDWRFCPMCGKPDK